ncbi:hypothetical protein DLAC_05339 [Tieghemostelium lacteum]|uniref:Uncharacterized protein n=1 Tax=Tieghemostelium lacteum TaxID=361077 RepID=A0A151ZHW0_TIELA|nr:hypothetical protein DLAC_05339 [Tieghemostelium lacteum]|eukprot:KYQ93553.1 hypothetical protein DLAC_05339 [Tieghemostelium lacteum]
MEITIACINDLIDKETLSLQIRVGTEYELSKSILVAENKLCNIIGNITIRSHFDIILEDDTMIWILNSADNDDLKVIYYSYLSKCEDRLFLECHDNRANRLNDTPVEELSRNINRKIYIDTNMSKIVAAENVISGTLQFCIYSESIGEEVEIYLLKGIDSNILDAHQIDEGVVECYERCNSRYINFDTEITENMTLWILCVFGNKSQSSDYWNFRIFINTPGQTNDI